MILCQIQMFELQFVVILLYHAPDISRFKKDGKVASVAFQCLIPSATVKTFEKTPLSHFENRPGGLEIITIVIDEIPHLFGAGIVTYAVKANFMVRRFPVDVRYCRRFFTLED